MKLLCFVVLVLLPTYEAMQDAFLTLHPTKPAAIALRGAPSWQQLYQGFGYSDFQ